MNKKITTLSIIALVFVFASYNLWSYFDKKAIEEAEAEAKAMVVAEENRVRAEKEKQRQAEIREERARKKAEIALKKQQEQEKKKQLADEKKEKQLAKSEARKAEKEARKLAKAKETEQRKIESEKEKLQKLRTPNHIEGIYSGHIEELLSISPRYWKDHPEKASLKLDKGYFGNSSYKTLMSDNSNYFMLYSAITQDLRYLQAFLDLGFDINETNDIGASAFHFASAYNTPEVIQFLVDNKADVKVITYYYDSNALHLASHLNPNPDSIRLLIELGFSLEERIKGVRKGKKVEEKTPIMLAVDNKNLEIIEVLVNAGADTSVYGKHGKTLYHMIKRSDTDYDNHRNYKKKILEMVK